MAEKTPTVAWNLLNDEDRKAVLNSIQAYLTGIQTRRKTYQKQLGEDSDPVLLAAFERRESATEVAISILNAATDD